MYIIMIAVLVTPLIAGLVINREDEQQSRPQQDLALPHQAASSSASRISTLP